MAGESHNTVVRREFTRQAPAYTANPVVANPERVERLLAAIRPAPEARVLDVATGPGYIAMGFAVCRGEVVGLDLTEAPLDLARKRSEERGLNNLRLMIGDAMRLPFDTGVFDMVVCCLALHHMEDPRRPLTEMVRVCRIGGCLAIEDLAASDHPARAAYQNEVEILRDPSHVRALPLSETLRLLTEAGLEVESVQTYTNVQQAERWLAYAHTPEDRAKQVRALLARDEEHDLSGLRPVTVDGNLNLHTSDGRDCRTQARRVTAPHHALQEPINRSDLWKAQLNPRPRRRRRALLRDLRETSLQHAQLKGTILRTGPYPTCRFTKALCVIRFICPSVLQEVAPRHRPRKTEYVRLFGNRAIVEVDRYVSCEGPPLGVRYVR